MDGSAFFASVTQQTGKLEAAKISSKNRKVVDFSAGDARSYLVSNADNVSLDLESFPYW